MDEVLAQAVRNWLIKAKSDLESARILATASQPHVDTALYHCQQGAEKALKGFLVYKERFQKTHDLNSLISEASTLVSEFTTLQPEAARLTPYATEYRYPPTVTAYIEPGMAAYHEAIADAGRVYDFVLSKLPAQCKPDST